MTSAHHALAGLQVRIGLDDTMVTPVDDKPLPGKTGDNGVTPHAPAAALA